MDNGKFTIRFDRNGNRVDKLNKEQAEPVIIPLKEDEYRVETRVDIPVESQVNERYRDDVEYLDPTLLNQYTTDFGPWQSAFETETERVERIIRESQEQRNGVNDYYDAERAQDPYTQPRRIHFSNPHQNNEQRQESEMYEDWGVDQFWSEGDPELSTIYRKRPPMQWWKVAGAVAGAVVTGAAFGFFILTMLMGDGSKQESKSVESISTLGQVSTITPNPGTLLKPTEGTAGEKSTVKSEDTGATKSAASSTNEKVTAVPVKIEARSYVLLQHGIFSSAASLKSDVDSLKSKGILPATEEGDKSTVFAGIAASKAESQRLTKVFKDKKIDVYAKMIDLPALTQMKWTGAKPDQVGNMLNTGSKLMVTLSGIIMPHIEETRLTTIDAATINALKAAEQAWLTSAASLKDGDTSSMTYVQNMTKSLTAAIGALEAYVTKPATAQLWQAQSAMMQYVLAEKAFQQVIKLV
ncbi:hypothetical protein [Paenibacillus sp. KN14-4R]|uniref:hypothetical protein n=1 Tax=Paenibacillus sp. KN14-4R TaxID=3445773 RepID=UPI003F9FCB35